MKVCEYRRHRHNEDIEERSNLKKTLLAMTIMVPLMLDPRQPLNERWSVNWSSLANIMSVSKAVVSAVVLAM